MSKQRAQNRRHRPSTRPETNRQNPDRRDFGSNARRARELGPMADSSRGESGTRGNSISLDSVFDFVVTGDWDQAKSLAHSAAESARASQDPNTVNDAGLIWQIAQAFDQARTAMADENYATARSQAAHAATIARSLSGSGTVDAADLQIAIESAGEAWTLAKRAEDERAKRTPKGADVPIIDQHELDHSNNGAFCGIATMVMMLRANQIPQGSKRADLNHLADQVYHPGQGTSGAQMAAVLRAKGLEDSKYTTTGTLGRLVQTLDGGQTVPFGVLHSEGVITRLEGGASERYPGARVGDHHSKRFGSSGHWVLVVGYEGKAEAPTAFLVNDPDLGGQIRCTPDQIDAMGVGSGNYWMVHQ